MDEKSCLRLADDCERHIKAYIAKLDIFGISFDEEYYFNAKLRAAIIKCMTKKPEEREVLTKLFDDLILQRRTYVENMLQVFTHRGMKVGMVNACAELEKFNESLEPP